MCRRVLLLEPNYRNKYPPLNLMKLSRYFREVCQDDVRFFKGDLKNFAAQLLLEDFFYFRDDSKAVKLFAKYEELLLKFIRFGKIKTLDEIPKLHGTDFEKNLINLRGRFKQGDYPKFDVICVATLFTFFWKKTVDTINFAKKFLIDDGKLYVGGIAATLVPDALQAEVGENVNIHIGLLDKTSDLGKSDDVIIDTLPPDYSILEEINYKYPAGNSYFGYTTRGCIRKCKFCAVTTLEPKYKKYLDIREQLKLLEEQFGTRQNLLLMDNNVLASKDFQKIIDDLKLCGFAKNSTYIPSNDYEITLKNLRNGFNDRAYIKKMISLYDKLFKKLPEDKAENFCTAREKFGLLNVISATKEKIFKFDKASAVHQLFEKYFKHSKRKHYVDFNQGLDARLMNEEITAKLAEICIRPLRIAFDHYSERKKYEAAVRLAVKFDIRNLSNYMLYNFNDKPDDLYKRLKLNIDLCEELNVAIYSFPMKYHPISDPEYFRNRDYLGKHWNRKFIRAIQAILNSTKGKIGRGRSFFENAFGKNLDEFHDILWMPEVMIIYREYYRDNLTKDWLSAFYALNKKERKEAEEIIKLNKFSDEDILKADSEKVRAVLKFYQLTRDEHKKSG